MRQQIAGWPLSDLRLLRATIFAKHGRTFREPEIQEYLAKQDWYKPDGKFSNEALNKVERASIDVVRGMETRLHSVAEPGDFRFLGGQVLTAEQIGSHPIEDLIIMRAEIEAIHGRKFKFESLHTYFTERYWYRPAERYDPSVLSPSEKGNAALLDRMISKQLGLNVEIMGYRTGTAMSASHVPSVQEKMRQQAIERSISERPGG